MNTLKTAKLLIIVMFLGVYQTGCSQTKQENKLEKQSSSIMSSPAPPKTVEQIRKLVEQGLKDGSIRGEWQTERIPMGRLAEPHEIAEPIVYLASDRASYITGQVLVVDGGWIVQGMVHIADRFQR